MRKGAGVYGLATVMQFLIGVFIFGTGYALVLYIGRWPANVWTGGIIGIVHGLAVGLSLPLLARYDPAVRKSHARNPGLFALNYGTFAAFGLVAVHVLYGVVFGLTYHGGAALLWTNAWLAGLIATAAMSIVILLGKIMRLVKISTIDLIASTLSELLR